MWTAGQGWEQKDRVGDSRDSEQRLRTALGRAAEEDRPGWGRSPCGTRRVGAVAEPPAVPAFIPPRVQSGHAGGGDGNGVCCAGGGGERDGVKPNPPC